MIPKPQHPLVTPQGMVDPVWFRWFSGLAPTTPTPVSVDLSGYLPNTATVQGIGALGFSGTLADGTVLISLRPLEDTGVGAALVKITRDSYGRAAGTEAATAADLPYDPTTSGLSATDVQAAIDEVAASGGGATPTGTGFRHVTSGAEDAAARLVVASDLSVAATKRVIGRNTAGAGTGEEVTLSQLLDWVGSAADGDILYRASGAWTRLPKGANGQVLTLAAGVPSWAAASGGGSSYSYSRIVPVQEVNGGNTSSNNRTVVLPSAPTSGNIIVMVTAIGSAATVSGITQTGVTWTKKASSSTLAPTVEIWIGVVGSGATGSALIGFSGTGFNTCYMAELSGWTGTLDQSSGSTAVTTGYFTDTITPAGNNLIVAAMGTSNGTVPFVAANNWESKSIGAMVTPVSVLTLSGNATLLGTMNVSMYQTNAPTRVCYSTAGGNHSSVIASFT